MKHILTILIMMLALGSYASEPSVTDSISSAEKVDDGFTCREIMGEPDS